MPMPAAKHFDPVIGRTAFGYDRAGNLDAIATPDGAVMRRAHDLLGRVVSVTDPKGNKAGLWCIGRLQTDVDRARVVEGLAGAGGGHSATELAAVIKGLEPRWFLVRNAHDWEGVKLVMVGGVPASKAVLTKSGD